MIAVDTSALMAILLGEAEGDHCARILEMEDNLIISAGTLAEALIVAGRLNIGEEMAQLVRGLGMSVINVTPAGARRVADAYAQWSKGMHPAALNFGDCFAYELASEQDCPLLYVGEDFSRTDLKSAGPGYL